MLEIVKPKGQVAVTALHQNVLTACVTLRKLFKFMHSCSSCILHFPSGNSSPREVQAPVH